MTGVYLLGAAALSISLVGNGSAWGAWTRPLGFIAVGFLLGMAVCAVSG